MSGTGYRRHECRYFKEHRGTKWCTWCFKRKYKVAPNEWRWSTTLQQFANKWLPAVSGTDPETMMRVDVSFPFEFQGNYETWVVAFRVRFDFTDVAARVAHGMGTLTDVMNGWRSDWEEDFCRIDYAAERYFAERTGKPYEIGDNAYREMRAVIQSPVGRPQTVVAPLSLVPRTASQPPEQGE